LRGAILAAQNWRLAGPELQYCLNLITPWAIFASARHAARLVALERDGALRKFANRGRFARKTRPCWRA